MKRLILPPLRPSFVSETFRGRSFVVGFYLLIVAITGAIGAVLAVLGPEDLTAVKLLGLVELQPTPLGLAVYGAVTVGLVLGVLLGLVVVVSELTDTESARKES
jgi:uncharacterized integral membrane protein